MNLSERLAILSPAGLARYVSPNWIYGRHLETVNHAILDMLAGKYDRLMVSMPPQHGKSVIISGTLPAWLLGNWPTLKIILASYESTYAAFWGGKARDTLNAAMPVFGPTIKGGEHAATGFWETMANGYLATAGIGGPITGKGADWFIIDDPVKNAEEAASPTIQAKHWEWYHSTALSRLQPGGKMILLMTRWNENDLAGQILKSEPGKWRVINLPAICDTENDPIGRNIGDALFPERYSIAELTRKKADTPAYWWEAMYQGRPSPREGGLFKREWWRYYRELPKVIRHIWSWDTAIKTGQQNDYTVGQCWAECENGYYLVRQIRARMEYPALRRAVRAAYDANRADAVLIEDKASGQQAIQDLRDGTNMPIIPIMPVADKLARITPHTGIIEAGKVFLPEQADFVSALVEEFAAFPNGAHDDQVDAMAQALTYLRRDVETCNIRIF